MKISNTRMLWLVSACLCLLPVAAHAQSAFTGVVKDTSGAVLPGVTVEAASPVLIEKTRSVVTDETGGVPHRRSPTRRLHVDLLPGRVLDRQARRGWSSPSNFTMTVNAELKVGSLEETLTVTGASPTVDVQSTTKSQVLNREALDAIPTGRTIQGMGQLITGVSLEHARRRRLARDAADLHVGARRSAPRRPPSRWTA